MLYQSLSNEWPDLSPDAPFWISFLGECDTQELLEL